MSKYVQKPYWWDDAGLETAEIAADPALLPDRTDVLIIGAGYSGLSAALTLARAGRTVVIVDAGMPGYGCSGRNGGLIGPSFHKMGLSGLTAAYGEKKAHGVLRESMDTLTYLLKLIETEKIDCDLKPNGRFRGALNPKSYDAILKEVDGLHKAVGLNYIPVSNSEQHSYIGSDHYHGGVVYPDDGHLQPAKLVRGLARRAQEADVKIFAPAKVISVRNEGRNKTVTIGDHQIKARQVLIATNGFTGPEFPYFRSRIIPLRSAIIATEEMDPSIVSEISPRNMGFGDSSRLVLYYRPSPDGKRLVFGGRAFDLSDRPDRYTADLRRLLDRVFPQLTNVRISHAWSGTVAYTFDHAPHLGEHEGIHYSMGYCGSGVGRAVYFGNKIALKMLGSKNGATELDDLEFRSRPFYTGKPWFLPYILRWHSMLDRMGF